MTPAEAEQARQSMGLSTGQITALRAEIERLERELISAAETININHARAEAAEAERERLRIVVKSLREIIDRNMVDSGQEQHRLFLDGEVYTGPAVDFLHRLMTAIRGLCDKALTTSTEAAE